MKDSWGLAAQIGMDYLLSDNIPLNAQVRYIDIDTTGTTTFAGDKVKVDVAVDPLVYMVGLGYKVLTSLDRGQGSYRMRALL